MAPNDVKAGMRLAFFFGVLTDYTSILIQLAAQPWHRSHEDIAMALDELRLRDPQVAHAFYNLALSRHEYLAYDDAHALGVKCIWGLGNMGTSEAIAALAKLAKVGNPIFTENVEDQLDRIEQRSPSDDVRRAIERARDGE